MRLSSDIVKERVKRGVALSALLHLSFVLPFIVIALPILRFAKDTPPIENVEDDEVMMVDVLVFSENEPESLPPSQFVGIEGITQAPEFIEPMEDVLPKTTEKEEPDTEKAKIETPEAEATEVTATTEKEADIEEVEAKEAKVEEAQEVRKTPEAAEAEATKAEVVKVEAVEEIREEIEAEEVEAEVKKAEAVEMTAACSG